MARAAGIFPASVQRLWAASEINPYLWRTVTGLYPNPPEKALVLCVILDEFGRALLWRPK
jgi:hypothetical protein